MRSNGITKLCTLVGVGGVAGFVRTRSVPSLAAGLGIGSMYAVAGMDFCKKLKEISIGLNRLYDRRI